MLNILILKTGGKKKTVRNSDETFKPGDIVGCGLDLTIPQITFSVNGKQVLGFFKDCNLTGLFFPVISMSAKVGLVKTFNMSVSILIHRYTCIAFS